MKRVLFIILSVVSVFVVLGIVASLSMGRGAPSVAQRDFGYGGGAAPEISGPPIVAPAAEPEYDLAAEEAVDLYNTGSAQAQDRLVIQNADIGIVVRDPRARMAEISALANEFGGYVVSSNVYQSTSVTGKEVPQASITVRIPSERLGEALERIKEDTVDVPYENRSGQDVTNIYVDLQAQLKAKQAAEAKLLEIMDQATRAEDVLAIYLQVQQVQTEIEQLKGQIQYYEESAALSSINVSIIAEESTQPIEIGPWSPQGAAKDAIQDLIFFVQNFVEVLIRFVLLTLPALILIAIPLFLLYLAGRAVYRRVRRSRVEVEDIRSDEIKK